jgi:hypothetical protein
MSSSTRRDGECAQGSAQGALSATHVSASGCDTQKGKSQRCKHADTAVQIRRHGGASTRTRTHYKRHNAEGEWPSESWRTTASTCDDVTSAAPCDVQHTASVLDGSLPPLAAAPLAAAQAPTGCCTHRGSHGAMHSPVHEPSPVHFSMRHALRTSRR